MKVAQSIKSGRVTVEVQHLLGDATFRGVSMSPTEGPDREPDRLVVKSSNPLLSSEGWFVRVDNLEDVLGEPVDGKGPVKSELRRPIHRSAPWNASLDRCGCCSCDGSIHHLPDRARILLGWHTCGSTTPSIVPVRDCEWRPNSDAIVAGPIPAGEYTTFPVSSTTTLAMMSVLELGSCLLQR